MQVELKIFSFVILIFSVIIHEISHGYMALALGDGTAKYQGRLTLNPIKHIDLVGSIIVPILTSLAGVTFGWAKPVPFNPYNLRNRRWGEALVAIAGPLSNIVLAVLFGSVIRLYSIYFSEVTITLMSIIVIINLVLAIFNLIPVPPLDGSKILFSFLPQRFTPALRRLEQAQFLLILIVVFVLWQFFQPLIIIFYHLLTGLSL